MTKEAQEKENENGGRREDSRAGASGDRRRRRMIIGFSLVGLGAMAAATLLQTGIVRHLPDPPLEIFDSDAVISSDVAYAVGGADAALSVASLAVNIPWAAYGPAQRFRTSPLVPIAFAGKALAEAIIAGWFMYQMSFREKKACLYCIVNAASLGGVALLAWPEARKALRALGSSGTADLIKKS